MPPAVEAASTCESVAGWICEILLSATGTTRGEISLSMPLALPGWKEKPVDDACFPDIGVAVPQLAFVTGIDADFVGQVIVQTKFGFLLIIRGQEVIGIRRAAKRLLHAKERFQASHRAVLPAKV